jgi:hypothetical protein
MPLRPTLFDLMSRIVRAHANVLLAYQTDFWLHDQYALLYQTRPGDEYVWILRDHGTELFRLYQGTDAVAVSYWLGADQPHNRAYHVVCMDERGYGTVQPLTRERAIELASLPQRGPLTLTAREQVLLDHLKSALRCVGYSHHHELRRAAAFVERLEFTTGDAVRV